jgi:hypothetical protein
MGRLNKPATAATHANRVKLPTMRTRALDPVPARRDGVDEGLIRRQLEMTPSERLHGLEAMYAQARALALAGARSRGEHT